MKERLSKFGDALLDILEDVIDLAATAVIFLRGD